MAEDKEPTPEIEMVRSDRFVQIYANNAQLDTTPWDFRLIFGEIVRTGAKLTIEQSVAVTMSPQHAKAFVNLFTEKISQYEKSVGEIKLPAQAPTESEKPLSTKK